MSTANISIFSLEISKLHYIKKYRDIFYFNVELSIVLYFFGPLNVVLINMVAILMMSRKLATLSLLKLKIFRTEVMAS